MSEEQLSVDTEITIRDALDELSDHLYSGQDRVFRLGVETEIDTLLDNVTELHAGRFPAIHYEIGYYRKNYKGQVEKVYLTLANMLHDRRQGL